MIEKATQWILHNSLPGKGMIDCSRQRLCYPEVTGYFIPTLLSIGLKDLARQYALWLTGVQRADGAFGGPGGQGCYAFDTGQVVRGWVSILPQLPELEPSLRRACAWLMKSADSSSARLQVPNRGGAWSLGARGEVNEGIHLYVLGPLLGASRVLREERYRQFAEKSLEYYTKNVNLTDFDRPNALTHFYAYIQEALLDLGREDLARKGMASVARFQQANGAVPGFSNVAWVCSTGLAQLAMVWYRLGEGERADKAMQFLSLLQNPSGGFFGSYGVGASYFPDSEIAWAAKYAIEASQWEIRSHFDRTVRAYPDDINELDGRVKAILSHTGDLACRRVLDAGCGKGRFARLFKSVYPGAQITAMDISPEMLACVPAGIETVRASILDAPFPPSTFDVVICVEALEHVVNIGEGIRELTRVLRPGGQLIIIDKNQDKVGALAMPHWEKWFSSGGLTREMEMAGLQTTVDRIGHDHVQQPDGLFLCWAGRKAGAANPSQAKAAEVLDDETPAVARKGEAAQVARPILAPDSHSLKERSPGCVAGVTGKSGLGAKDPDADPSRPVIGKSLPAQTVLS